MLRDAVIIGAGPAGLAAAACFQRAGLSYALIEKAPAAGASWRNHYTRLHLHTPKEYSALPFLPYPDDYPRYPSREQVVEYLDTYAAHLETPPQLNETVLECHHDGSAWTTQTDRGQYRSRGVVVGTGLNHTPHVPHWPGEDGFGGTRLHANDYVSGQTFSGQRALVVGFGNSGGEIAIDLLEHNADVAMSVRSPVNIMPRDILGLPIVAVTLRMQRFPPSLLDAISRPIQRLKIGDLSKYGLQRKATGPATQIAQKARIPLVDIGTIGHIKAGDITVYPGIERFEKNSVVFTDGRAAPFDVVVLATGYTPDFGFLRDVDLPADPIDLPIRGHEGPAPHLYFSGFRVTSTGTLREIGLEAAAIAEQLAAA